MWVWCVYMWYVIYILIVSYRLSARGDNEQHYFYFKFLSTSISRVGSQSMKFYFYLKTTHKRMVDFQKTEHFAHSPRAHSLTASTHTHASEGLIPLLLYTVSILMYWIGWVFELPGTSSMLPADILWNTKTINWIPDDMGRMTCLIKTYPMLKWNKTGFVVFIDWWPCMHCIGHTDYNVHRHTACLFFSSQPKLISLHDGKRKNPPI